VSGPEHYRVAEVLLGNLRDQIAAAGPPLRTTEQQTRMIAEAQAHATLALVAAQIEAVAARGPGDVQQTWVEVVTS
jgi:hypothetical protein